MNKFISVAIIGVQKAATSSLYSYLLQHPKLIGHDDSIEFSYFIREEDYEIDIHKIWKSYFKKSDHPNKLYTIKSAGNYFY